MSAEHIKIKNQNRWQNKRKNRREIRGMANNTTPLRIKAEKQ